MFPFDASEGPRRNGQRFKGEYSLRDLRDSWCSCCGEAREAEEGEEPGPCAHEALALDIPPAQLRLDRAMSRARIEAEALALIEKGR